MGKVCRKVMARLRFSKALKEDVSVWLGEMVESPRRNHVNALPALANMNSKDFPEHAVFPKLLPHAKEGLILLKEVDLLCQTCPKVLSDLGRRPSAEGKPMGAF